MFTTWNFWKAALERAFKTVAQTALSVLTIGGITGILDVALVPLLSASGLAGVISILTSIVSAGVTNGSPSLTNAEVLESDYR